MDSKKQSALPSFNECDAPMREVAGKVAFITGGSSGIGLGIAQACAHAGMNVVVGYRTSAHLEQAMACLETSRTRVHAVQVDVADRAGMEIAAEETVRRFGKIHLLVNNAGVNVLASVSGTSYEDWDWLMSVNLTGVFNGVRAFLPRIAQQGEGGHIVAVSSVLGLFTVPGLGAYCASKFGVVGLMEALHEELAGTGIGVSVCCPGVVRSNLDDADRNRPQPADEQHRAVSESQETTKTSPIAVEPVEVGRLVLQGIRRNDLYILTHPEFEPIVSCRARALEASFPRDMHVSDVRVQAGVAMRDGSGYASEQKRERSMKGPTPDAS